jgi:hypothetical protein
VERGQNSRTDITRPGSRTKRSAAATRADGTAPVIAAAANKGIGAMPAGGQAISQGSQPGCNKGRRGKSGNQGKVRCPQFSSSKQADAVGTLLPSLRQYRPLVVIFFRVRFFGKIAKSLSKGKKTIG